MAIATRTTVKTDKWNAVSVNLAIDIGFGKRAFKRNGYSFHRLTIHQGQ